MLRSAQLTPLCAAPEQSCPPASAVCPSNRSMEDTTGYKINSFKPHQSPRCTRELCHPCSANGDSLQSQHGPILPSKGCRLSAIPSGGPDVAVPVLLPQAQG